MYNQHCKHKPYTIVFDSVKPKDSKVTPLTPNVGSPETVREAPRAFDFYDYACHGKPAHVPLDSAFLQWFIGFTEGEGCFSARWTGRYWRLTFEICQKDPKLLYKIKRKLGFGRVDIWHRPEGSPSGPSGDFWVYRVDNVPNLKRLVWLFQSNLVLPKRQRQFKHWLSYRPDLGPSHLDMSSVPSFSLNDAWLSGFIEAEGCFFAAFYVEPSGRLRLSAKFTLTPKDAEGGEFNVLRRVGELVQSQANVTLVSGKPPCVRLEVGSLESHRWLVQYFKQYPLQGFKKIAYLRWYRLYLARLQKAHLNKNRQAALVRLCVSLNQSGRKDQAVQRQVRALLKESNQLRSEDCCPALPRKIKKAPRLKSQSKANLGGPP